MKLIFNALVVLLLIALSSCEFEPHGIFERNLNQDVEAPILQSLESDLSEDSDTLDLIYRRVYFNFVSSNQDIRWINFFINDSLVGTINSGKGYYDFNYPFLKENYYRLRLEIFTKSGTGSIADSLHAEGFLFKSKQWIIKVRETNFGTLTSSASDGFLKLRWIPHSEIKEYIIYRSNYEIGRTTSCEFIDKGYVGEGGSYRVFYADKYHDGQLSVYGTVEIPKEIFLSFKYDTENNYFISWGDLKYYAAVDSFILLSRKDTYEAYELGKTTDIGKGGFEVSENCFGQYRQFQLVLIPKYPNPMYSQLYKPYSIFASPIYNFMIGYPSPIFNHFYRVNNSEFIYHTSMYDHGNTAYNDSMFRFSVTKNKIIERIRYNPPGYSYTGDHYWNPTVSPDGKNSISVVGFTQTAIFSSTSDFSSNKIIDISTLTDNVMKIPISNVGTGIVYGLEKRYLFDFINNKRLGTINETTSFSDYNISPDGKYFFFSLGFRIYLYAYEDNNIYLAKTLHYSPSTPSFDYFNFMADETGKAVSWSKESKTFDILNCPDLSIVKSFSVNEDNILDIDYSTNRILSFSPKVLVVRSLNDGSILYSIPVGFSTINQNNCQLHGNAIFHQQGARYFLN